MACYFCYRITNLSKISENQIEWQRPEEVNDEPSPEVAAHHLLPVETDCVRHDGASEDINKDINEVKNGRDNVEGQPSGQQGEPVEERLLYGEHNQIGREHRHDNKIPVKDRKSVV